MVMHVRNIPTYNFVKADIKWISIVKPSIQFWVLKFITPKLSKNPKNESLAKGISFMKIMSIIKTHKCIGGVSILWKIIKFR